MISEGSSRFAELGAGLYEWRMRDKVTAMRAIVFVITALVLGGCMQGTMQGTLSPATEAGWSARDRQLMTNLPYRQTTIPMEYRRYIVQYTRKETPGTIVVDTGNKFLYYVLPKGEAIRYGITVGEDAQAWSGIATVGRKEEWPSWTPTAGEHARLGPLPAFVSGGPQNPMGARGLYLFSGGKDTQYRIHGTNQPEYIGRAISSGCIRMTNEDVIDLYNRAKLGTIVVVLPPNHWAFAGTNG
jgi:lipoprotein-anchoring transpeptidase ErfK/SrfK